MLASEEPVAVKEAGCSSNRDEGGGALACDNEGGFSAVARDHAVHPRHHGHPQHWDGHARVTGPCGDTMEFWVNLGGRSVEHVSFETDGCGASRACGSMAVTLSEGRLLDDVLVLEQAEILEALAGIPTESEHCALLAATTLRAACQECLRDRPGTRAQDLASITVTGGRNMRIAVPLTGGRLSPHFGHCESFALVDVDSAEKKVVGRQDVAAPPHEPGLLPAWLAERGATMIIAGGMGRRAQDLFAQQGIEVVVGAAAVTPELLVSDYLLGTLKAGENICDH